MKVMPTILLTVLVIIYIKATLGYWYKIKASNRIGAKGKGFHLLFIWLIPFVWYGLVKDFIKPTEVMTKSKRKLDTSTFYESGKGTMV